MSTCLDKLNDIQQNLNQGLIESTAYMISEMEIGDCIEDVELLDEKLIKPFGVKGVELKNTLSCFYDLVASGKMRLEHVRLNKDFKASTYRRI